MSGRNHFFFLTWSFSQLYRISITLHACWNSENIFLSKTVGFENQSIQKRLDTNRDLTWSPIKLFYWWPYDSRVMATRTVPRDSDKKSREVTEKHVKYILAARRQWHVQRDNDNVVVVRHVCRVSDVFLL